MQLTPRQGQRLTTMMLAMRPDWTPNNPGQLLATANQTGLPGHDFAHTIRALANYSTAIDENGKPQYRTPNLFTQDGKYWTETAPTKWSKPKPPPCEDHPEQEAPTCRCCHADVKAGDRPTHMIGKHWPGTIAVGSTNQTQPTPPPPTNTHHTSQKPVSRVQNPNVESDTK